MTHAAIEEARAILYLVVKDLQVYYMKPPNLSWGLLFPLSLAFAFLLVRPLDVASLAPGLVGMAVLFGSTSMAAIDVTFERRVGTLDRLLLAPITFPGLILAKILASAIFGCATGLIMLLLALFLFGSTLVSPLLLALSLTLASLACSALGVLIAVSLREVFEAQTLCNLLRFPMIFLCGVILPLTALPHPLLPLALALPLTYAVELLRASLAGVTILLPLWLCAGVLTGYLVALHLFATVLLQRRFR